MSIEPVLHSFAYSLDYLRDQVADVDADIIVAKPFRIQNHPLWVIGHLAFACELLGGAIGTPAWLPDGWAQRYGTGSEPREDPKAYESKATALAILRDAQSRLATAAQNLSDAELAAPFPDPAYLDVFPTIRHAFTQVLVGHAAFHIGQVSVWRKAMRLPSMRRSFE
jgi:hypothetical protein